MQHTEIDIDIHIEPPIYLPAEPTLVDARPAEWIRRDLEARKRAFADAELEAGLAPLSETNFWVDLDHDTPVGIFVATYQELSIGTPTWVRMCFPTGEEAGALAAVEWVRDPFAESEDSPGLGLRFEHLDDRTAALVRRFASVRPPVFVDR